MRSDQEICAAEGHIPTQNATRCARCQARTSRVIPAHPERLPARVDAALHLRPSNEDRAHARVYGLVPVDPSRDDYPEVDL